MMPDYQKQTGCIIRKQKCILFHKHHFPGHRREFILPDRSKYVNIEKMFLKSYMDLLIKTCHKRGALATGGMAALLLPWDKEGLDYQSVLAKVRRYVQLHLKLMNSDGVGSFTSKIQSAFRMFSFKMTVFEVLLFPINSILSHIQEENSVVNSSTKLCKQFALTFPKKLLNFNLLGSLWVFNQAVYSLAFPVVTLYNVQVNSDSLLVIFHSA